MLGIKFKKIKIMPHGLARDLIGIDFSGNNLKLAHLRISPNKQEVVNLLVKDISGLKEEDISNAIREALISLKIKNPQVINIVPSHLVITKNIEIPSIDSSEIKGIINLQAGRHTPYSREEIIVDYLDIGTHKQNYTKILLVILARNVAKRQCEILRAAGIRLDRIFLSCEGVGRTASIILRAESENAPISIINIDQASTDFSVVFKDRPIFIRNISVGNRHFQEDKEKYMARFIEEVRRSLEAYQSEDIEKIPSQIILTGAISELKELEEQLNQMLHIPLKSCLYSQNLSISNPASQVVSAAKGLSFLDLIACLLACEDLKVNLIPEEVKLSKAFEERSRELIKTGMLLIILLVLFFSVLVSKIYFKAAYLKKLNVKYLSLEEKVKGFEGDFVKIGIIKNFLVSRGYALEVLTELYSIIPLDIELNEIRYETSGNFSMRGSAQAMSMVFNFVDDLEESEYFKDVKTKYTTKRKVGTVDLADFEIVCELEKATKQ